MKKLLSIVIPTYNRVNSKRCLKSIDLKSKNIEVIIVDDGSFMMLKKFKNYGKKLKFIELKILAEHMLYFME